MWEGSQAPMAVTREVQGKAKTSRHFTRANSFDPANPRRHTNEEAEVQMG